MIVTIQKIYDSVQLNLGIKHWLHHRYWNIKREIDNRILFPIFRSFVAYFFRSEMYHYGAEYRWNDQKSQNLDIDHNNYGYGVMHYALIKNLRPKRVLCVGSMYGYIPYMMAKACMENGAGHVDFVDAAFDFNDEKYKTSHYFGKGFWKKVNPKRHFSYLLDSSFISTHIMTLEEFLRSTDHSYDYVYLDGDHSYAGLIRDIKLVWKKMPLGAILCLHDIEFDFQGSLKNATKDFRSQVGHITFGVDRVWRAVKKEKYRLPILNGYSGIGLIHKNRVQLPFK